MNKTDKVLLELEGKTLNGVTLDQEQFYTFLCALGKANIGHDIPYNLEAALSRIEFFQKMDSESIHLLAEVIKKNAYKNLEVGAKSLLRYDPDKIDLSGK